MAGKYALLIGNDSYKDKLFGPLTVPRADVQEFREVLLDPAICGFTSAKILFNCSSASAAEEVGDFFADKLPDDLVLFYFSGHGALDAEGHLYLAFEKSRRDRLTSTALWSNQIKKEMDNSRSRRQVLFLDCCYSGAFERGGKDAKSGIGVRAINEATFEVKGYGREILTSSSATQRSWEGNQVIGDTRMSLFTHYLVEGLKSGNAAVEDSEAITVDQLYQYVHAKVVNAGARMTPQRWVDRLEGSIAIANNPTPVLRLKPLPENLLADLHDPAPHRREGAVNELGRFVGGDDGALALSALNALKGQLKKERDVVVRNALEEALGGAQNAVLDAQRHKRETVYAHESPSISKAKPNKNRSIANNIELYRYPIIIGAALILLFVAGYREKFFQMELEPLDSPNQQKIWTKKDENIDSTEKGMRKVKTVTQILLKAFTVFRDTLRDGSKGPEMVVIPAGSFTMGSPETEKDRDDDESPQHKVSIPKPFALGKNEISVDDFGLFVNANGYRTGAETDLGCHTWSQNEWKLNEAKNWRDPGFKQAGDHPVVCVSRNDAKGYAAWLSKQTGKNYRLPSEAEWEYAARAGTSSARFWGDNPDDACTFANVADKTFQQKFPNSQVHNCTDGYVYTAPVGKFAENKFKLQHTLGNVWEWTEDCWHENYDGAPNDGSAWVEDGDCSRRVIRGGSWSNGPGDVRSAYRNWNYTDDRFNNVGFRLAQDL